MTTVNMLQKNLYTYITYIHNFFLVLFMVSRSYTIDRKFTVLSRPTSKYITRKLVNNLLKHAVESYGRFEQYPVTSLRPLDLFTALLMSLNFTFTRNTHINSMSVFFVHAIKTYFANTSPINGTATRYQTF